MDFNATVKSDSAGQLRGAVRCTLTPGGLGVAKGKQPPAVMIAHGAPALYEGANRFTVGAGGRSLTLAVNKFGSYQRRLAREVVGYLSGARHTPPDASEFKVEPWLLIPAVLPFGIMIVTRGGAIWGALGGAVAVACLAVAQLEQLPKFARLGIILAINAAVYAAVIAMMSNATT